MTAAPLAVPAFAQTYPTKPIRMIVAQAAGGPTDVVTRIYASKLSEILGQQIVVDNRVGAGGTVAGEVVLRAEQNGSKATIEVADTGPGIAPAAQSRVFDRVYSLEGNGRDGFGLGLAIARESAEAIGGTLAIESEAGRGTIARLTLPAVRRG